MTDLLADHTTLRVGGPARRWVVADTERLLVDTIRACDAAGEPVLILGGGSNLVVGDAGFDGTVVQVATKGIDTTGGSCSLDGPSCGGRIAVVAAGEGWDDFVSFAIDSEWIGVEALSGIPGLVGATPIQNVGAYGQEVAQTITSVRTFDRQTGHQVTFDHGRCGFGYRHSRFKAEPGRYVVLDVTFQFREGDLGAPIRYGELARRLGVEGTQRVRSAQIRQAVLDLRRGKGMVLDVADHDTWSAGSFFTNPILEPADAARLPEAAPRYPAPGERIKTSAAWLIENAGYGKGYGVPPATLSTKHSLALTNRGGARAADIIALAREIREGVAERFGVTLVPEPVLVGCALD
ncbi:MAG: UDP-N-acetylmuramate dehydrogenase [Micropruina sp.]